MELTITELTIIELTITTQKWDLKKMSTEFWDAIKEGKLILRYFRILIERKNQNQNKKAKTSKPTQTKQKQE